nr:MAG TPA: hypothetical protein [Inoviridae sp.]
MDYIISYFYNAFNIQFQYILLAKFVQFIY